MAAPGRASGRSARSLATVAQLSLREQVGQRLMVAMNGYTAPRGLLHRIGRGEVGGVILFAANVRTQGQVRALAASLQAAANAASHPVPLLIAVDQEGGIVKRLPGPPRYSEPELGERNSRALARASSQATARSLASYGINTNLAPVLDVPDRAHPTMLARAYGRGSRKVARLGAATIRGMQAGRRVIATAKHFPGLGATDGSTDDLPGRVTRSVARLNKRDLPPFRAAVGAGVGMVMTSTAVYAKLDRRPASLSARIVGRKLRGQLGFRGVVISDALETPAIRAVESTPAAAIDALRAGVDIALVASATGVDRLAYRRMVAAARGGRIDRADLRESVQRILDLKTRFLVHD